MQRITTGHLRVYTYTHIYEFPAPSSTDANPHDELVSELRVVNDAFWIRLCTMGDLGFSEAYMYGDVECDNLVVLFKIFLLNRKNLSNLDSKASYLFTLPQKLTSYRFLNTISNSQSNISAHYDISNEMFAGFLSEDMTYSCAIFSDLDKDLKSHPDDLDGWSGGQGLRRLDANAQKTILSSTSATEPSNDELYEAQNRKLRHIISKAKVQENHRVLEIGSGWGSCAILLAQTYPGTTVDTLTLSVHQKTLAEKRIAEAGLQDRIKVHLMDYRCMPPEWEGSFDRFISIEMIEAVGAEYLAEYWRKVDWALKTEGGVGVVQVITIPEPRYDRYIQEIDFIRKWVLFPGGFLPTVTLLLSDMQKGSSGRLVTDSISNIGPHYARTLREWRRRFLKQFDSVIVPALKAEYPTVMNGLKGREEIEVFKRKWLCDCYCEVGFTTRTLGDHIITFTREGCQEFGCDV
ncbi:CFS1-like protein [Coniophora puteana RWD-64-598 SS2]|uniref:CFS1-like protein n=1 Tax=Coniophora puteana (strain RWD-64-598) TaxID=741705 RepID=A0A5M3MP80_CONPW|nr:CFS1-like protein [Coniophora puteana RWD-64-598 SS2]EIW80982.1 CFS1-like protein [Coniophora puteana RWD-64-598 SS2]